MPLYPKTKEKERKVEATQASQIQLTGQFVLPVRVYQFQVKASTTRQLSKRACVKTLYTIQSKRIRK